VVVDAEFNGTNKTTLRSEWSCMPEKRKERIKNTKTVLDTSRHYYRAGKSVEEEEPKMRR
jgi:hypothetical protein